MDRIYDMWTWKTTAGHWIAYLHIVNYTTQGWKSQNALFNGAEKTWCTPLSKTISVSTLQLNATLQTSITFFNNIAIPFHPFCLISCCNRIFWGQAILNHLNQFGSLFQMLIIYEGHVCPSMEYVSHMCGRIPHTQLFGNGFLSHSAPVLLPFLSSIDGFMLIALFSSLTACFHHSFSFAVHDFFTLGYVYAVPINREVFSFSSILLISKLWNSLPLLHCMIWIL